MKKQIIFGLVGLMASGKGAAARHLADKYNAKVFKFSDVLRDMLDRLHIEKSRETITAMSEAVRDKFGEDTLAKTLAADVSKLDEDIVVVDGFRRIEDLYYFKDLPNFILVNIDASPEVRYKRLVNRAENAGESTKTFEQFEKDHEIISTETTIPEVQAKAEEKIENNGTYEEFMKQVDDLVKKYMQ